ncbi:Nickel-containing superoxide dismutase [Planctomycetes bacterium Poly30]|uniref:Nickel-containing superoxide dismutase n=1 Tax=Saltatorellus ferox TaxID=2528018 RepID=A0A518EWY3_9BACT|nr:Nickel-containing superoxide dismutase [Planctomycetes bacterium Poly30]
MLIGITLAAALLVPSPEAAAPTAAGAAAVVSSPAVVHCQVPCGIYGDHLRVQMITEDAATIEKAMKQIAELSAAEKPNWNQLVRWITTKDEHAQKIQDQVSAYWLAQRIKSPAAPQGSEEYAAQNGSYMTQLVMAHRLTTFAMKCKQTTDLANVQGLRDSLKGLEGAYFSKADLEHIHGADHKDADHDHK